MISMWNLKYDTNEHIYETRNRVSLVTQCLRILLPMQGTWVQSLAWEDAMGQLSPWAAATGSPRPRAHALQQRSHLSEKRALQHRAAPREPRLEPACRQGSEENPRQSLILKKKQNHGHREHTGGCQGEAGWGGTEWEAEVSRRKLLYIERVNKNKILLHSTENRIQYPAVNHTEN